MSAWHRSVAAEGQQDRNLSCSSLDVPAGQADKGSGNIRCSDMVDYAPYAHEMSFVWGMNVCCMNLCGISVAFLQSKQLRSATFVIWSTRRKSDSCQSLQVDQPKASATRSRGAPLPDYLIRSPQKLIPKTQRFEINLCPWQVQVKIQDSTTGQLVAFFFIFWWQFRPPTMMCRFAIFLGQTADSCWEAQMESIFLIARIKQHKTYLESLSFVLLSAGFLPSLADPCFHTSGMGSEFSGSGIGWLLAHHRGML